MTVLFTQALMDAASEILDKHHRAVATAIYGKDALSPDDWKLAIKLGLVDPKATGETLSSQIYRFGVLAAHMDQSQQQSRYGDSAETWLKEIRRNPLPMTTAEQRASNYANHKAAQFVVGLGRRASAGLTTTLIEEDLKLSEKFRSTIQDVVSANFGDNEAQARLNAEGVKRDLPDDFFDDAFRGTTKRIRSDLGHATGQWSRDLERIARTESVEAWNRGKSDEWLEEEREQAVETETPAEAVRAYRIPAPTACPDCRRLYTSGGELRIFYLADLLGNGTNYKRRRADWRPVVGATHPFCVCSLQRLPSYVKLPKGWHSGDTAPSVIDGDGFLVLPEDDA
jgi:hypothetical protein